MPALAALLTCITLFVSAGTPTTTAFVGVDVVPMDRERVLSDQTVVVRGARIVAVGPRAEVAIPDDATRIDAAGKVLLPGLADMHVHNWFRHEHALYVANGVTTLRSLWGTPQQKKWRDEPADDVPNYYTAGAIIDGSPPVWPNSYVVETPEKAREAVRFQHDSGYDFVKVYSRLAPDAFAAIADEAKTRGIPFGGHVPTRVALAEALASGMRCIEHLTGYDLAAQAADSPLASMSPDEWAEMPYLELVGLKGRHIDEARFADLAALTRKHGVWNCPTLVVKQRIVAAPATRTRLEQRPEMKYISPFVRQQWRADRFARFPDEQRAEIEASFAPSLVLTKALHDAGCDLLLGTDAPNPFVFPGFSIHEELALFVEAGLTPFEALRTGTVNAARFLDQADEFGQIRPGMRADLLLLDANPLTDIAHTKQIRGVMLRGTWFDRAALDKMLAQAANRFAPRKE